MQGQDKSWIGAGQGLDSCCVGCTWVGFLHLLLLPTLLRHLLPLLPPLLLPALLRPLLLLLPPLLPPL